MTSDSRNREHTGRQSRPDQQTAPRRAPRPKGARPDAANADGEENQGRPRGAAGALIELDRDLMKLLVRRAILVSRIRGGKEHAATPAAIQAEKAVRMAWEEGSLAFSKDPRFIRQLFTLLQDLKVMTKEEADSRGSFNLAPPQKPVSGAVTGPVSSRSAQMWAALAAGTGSPVTLRPVMLSDPLMHTVKALAQAGGSLTSQSLGAHLGLVRVAAHTRASLAGKTLFAGDDLFTLYLLAFMAADSVGICRLTGGGTLKAADLSGLRHTLPLLGARLAHVVPCSTGLPANLECSGIIPPSISVPADLPLDGVCALLLAPLVWNLPVVLDLSALPAAVATAALAEVDPLHRKCRARVDSRGPNLVFTPGSLELPEEPAMPLDPALSAYLLALPAFAGGSITLKGSWPAHLPEAHDTATLLAWAGIDLAEDEGSVTARAGKNPFASAPLASELPPALLPLGLALAARARRLAKGPEAGARPLPFDVETEYQIVAQDFFSRLGLALEDGLLNDAAHSTDAQGQAAPTAPAAWTSPDAYWSMGLALAAFLRPGLRLANPGNVSDLMPPFWGMYNTLPSPEDPAAPKATKDSVDDRPVKPAGRRFITG